MIYNLKIFLCKNNTPIVIWLNEYGLKKENGQKKSYLKLFDVI